MPFLHYLTCFSYCQKQHGDNANNLHRGELQQLNDQLYFPSDKTAHRIKIITYFCLIKYYNTI